ncbi:MAG: alpha-ketoacid dehydrogenase subunit beta [Planctomycetes bacterium]|nr:alpha-ketoacid dehydrogenase subunit beta [Planctomycetota bacterium]
MRSLTYLEAIREGLLQEIKRDKKVFMLGEDIGHFGGPFKVTQGFLEEFGQKRIIDTPICESGFIGFAVGAALFGLRPVVEIQFFDFVACGFNQIVNYAAKCKYRWGANVPLVIRGPMGAGNRAGPFHSQSEEIWFGHTPGLKVVMPATPYDAKGLIKAAIRDNDPVIYFEHKNLYRRIRGEVPEEDYIVPIGKAKVVQEGKDITIVTYGAMLHKVLEVIKEKELADISCEVVDLRTIYPLDTETIINSVKKTSRLLTVHEDSKTFGPAGEITQRVCEYAFDYLSAPPVRATSIDTPIPQSPTLEDRYLPSNTDIKKAIRKILDY